MTVYHSNSTQVHLENAGRRFYDYTRGNLGGEMAEGRIAWNTNFILFI